MHRDVHKDQLPDLVRAAQKDFVPMFFKTEGWFQHFVDEVYQSRCVVAHMNPLNQTNVDNVGIKFNQWETLVTAKIGDVEKLERRVTEPQAVPAEPAQLAPIQSAGVEVPSPAESMPEEVTPEDSSKPPTI